MGRRAFVHLAFLAVAAPRCCISQGNPFLPPPGLLGWDGGVHPVTGLPVPLPPPVTPRVAPPLALPYHLPVAEAPLCCVADDLLDNSPIRNQYLFRSEECPRPFRKGEAVCPAIAEDDRFVKPQTSLIRIPISSPTASVVAAGNACCFNLYSDVVAGDPLRTTCTSPLIGDATLVMKWITQTGVVAAGDVEFTGPAAVDVLLAVYVGGSLNVPGFPMTVQSSNGVPAEGPFAGFGLVVAERIPLGAVTVGQGDALIGDADDTDFVIAENGVVTVMSEGQRMRTPNILSATVCSLAHQMLDLPNTATVVEESPGVLLLTCTNTAADSFCIADVQDAVFDGATQLNTDVGDSKLPIFVRVFGNDDVVWGGIEIPFWVGFIFYDAQTVTWSGVTTGPPIFAPYAYRVTMIGPIDNPTMRGPIVMGNKRSTLTLDIADTTSGGLAFFSGFTELPEAKRELVACDCICPVEDGF